MAAVGHLEFVMRVFGPPTKAFGGIYHCAKLGWNRYRLSSFDASFNIFRVRPENVYRPKMFWGHNPWGHNP